MKRRPLIYLAGAIDNIPKWQAQQWREEATEVLAKLGCDVYNPLTAVMAVGSPEEVIEQNEQSLRSSDAVLAELWFPALHYGTVCEVEEAVSLNIPVIAWTEGIKVPIYLRRHGSVTVVITKQNALYAVAQAAQKQLSFADASKGRLNMAGLQRAREVVLSLREAFTRERQDELAAGNNDEAGYWKTDVTACEGVLAGLDTLQHRHNMLR